MIRTLLATTAIATLLATGAMAQTTTPQPVEPAASTAAPMVVKAEGNLASNIIGQSVYNSAGEEGQNIGSVNDLVLTKDGDVQAVVIGVGGFLGIGQKNVAIEYDLVQWTERDGKRYMVVETTADALKAQADFDSAAYQPMPADADVAEVKPATAEDLANAPVANDAAAPADNTAMAPAGTTTPPASDTMAAAPAGTTQAPAAAPADGTTAAAPTGTDTTQTAAIDRSTLTDLPVGDIRTEDFVGTTVYGANDENVGEIGDVVMSQDGKVDAIIINVGGFLGIGEKEVAVGLDNLAFMSDGDGNRYLYTNLTKEQLEAQPAYDEANYAAQRDQMRMVVPN